MKRFGLAMDDELHEEFRKIYPDHGVRSALLRSCVRRFVQQAKKGLRLEDANTIADTALSERRYNGDG